MEATRGLLILFVLVGHAIVSVYRDLTFFIPFLRFVSPSVFVFVYLFGYSQGRVRKRPLKVVQKALSFFLFYLFWGSVAFFLYLILDGRYSEVWVTRQIFNVENCSLFSKYLLTVFSFSGSWQYYFVFVVIILLFVSIFIRNPGRILPFSFAGAVVNSSIVSLWFLTKNELLPPIEGALITYLNPIHWLFPFILGYKDTHEGKKRTLNKTSLIFYIVFLTIGLLEYWNSHRKFNGFVADQFSLPGVVLGIYSIGVFSWMAEKMNSRILRRMGRYSFLLFMIHMPFQWMFYVFLDTFIDLPGWCWVLVMVGFSVAFMEILLRLSRLLPRALRKVVAGF
ncbi:hypothetical protein TRQ7_08395 [Thermotoga sp. RQ7]|uniref:acyltransferase family protein n=1 Tax=Thermotoga sp. RQ7 TaxID=126738 RepID=UPI0005A34FD1|nr:acyltransferase family protein [Thermotoga sp. RQ7]AJG41460.1 hypothetical protein TRQ7_08395 [Thermotoga sp. RQ7]